MQSDQFMINWLAERAGYDELARNPDLRLRCVQKVSEKDHIRVVDLGAGTGNNFFALWKRLPAHQEWLLVDHNEKLLTEAGARIIDWADEAGWQVKTRGDKIYLKRGDHNMIVCLIRKSVLEPDRITREPVDLYTANALFDLFTEADWQYFIDQISDESMLYFTLNICGNKLLPDLPDNRKFVRIFEAHMQRDGEGGRPMGADCVDFMKKTLEERGFSVETGQSDWKLGEEDQKMIRYLFKFMEDSIPEMLSEKTRPAFDKWLETKKKETRAGELQFHVFHKDLLAY